MLSISAAKMMKSECCSLISFLAKASPLRSVNDIVLDAYILNFNLINFYVTCSVYFGR